MRRECRAIDVVSRYGGEKFALIFPDADTAGAQAICERIRAALERFEWAHLVSNLKLTISAGAASRAADLGTPQELLEDADPHLYAAKRGGRNRVVADAHAAELRGVPIHPVTSSRRCPRLRQSR